MDPSSNFSFLTLNELEITEYIFLECSPFRNEQNKKYFIQIGLSVLVISLNNLNWRTQVRGPEDERLQSCKFKWSMDRALGLSVA